MEKIYDVIIAGGGPGGYTAALYCACAAMSVIVVKEPDSPGKIALTGDASNHPGFTDEIYGYELEEKMKKDAEKKGANTFCARIDGLDMTDNVKKVFTSKGELYSHCLILAMGVSPRKLFLPDETALTGKGISYCAACNISLFKNESVAVIGGGNSAISKALALSSVCSRVFVICSENRLKAAPYLVDAALASGKVTFFYKTDVTKFLSGDGRISGIEIVDKTSGSKGRLFCKGVFIAIGQVPNTKLCMPYVDTDENGYIIAGETTKTNVSGVFAIGDMRTKPVRRIITAAADGAVAAMYAEEYLRISQVSCHQLKS